jgi:hypothetical protein
MKPASNSEARARIGETERYEDAVLKNSDVKKRGVNGSPVRPKRCPRSRRRKGGNITPWRNGQNVEAEKKEDGKEKADGLEEGGFLTGRQLCEYSMAHWLMR